MTSTSRRKGKRKAADEALSDPVTGESIDFSEDTFEGAFGVNGPSDPARVGSLRQAPAVKAAPAVKELEAAKIDLRLAMELAAGLEDEATIAARYGYDEGTLALLKAWKPFQVAVSQFQTELESKGHTFKLVAKAAAQDIFQEVYVRVKSGLLNGDLTFGQAMDFLNYATRVSGLEPPKVAAAEGSTLQAGPAFTINIVAPSSVKAPITVDVTPEKVVEAV